MNSLALTVPLMLLTGAVALVAGPADAIYTAGPGADCATAGRTLSGVYQGAVAPGASHWYRVPNSVGLDVILRSDASPGLHLYVYVGQCSIADCPRFSSATVKECNWFHFDNARTVYIEVRNPDVSSNSYTLVVAGGHAVNPEVGGSSGTTRRCFVFNDENENGGPSDDEMILDVPYYCGAHPDVQGCTVYDDQNENGVMDSGETPYFGMDCPPLPKLAVNGDGTCTVYVDGNGNDARDVGEVGPTFVCPMIKAYHDTANGDIIIYDDKNGNDVVDPGETILVIDRYP